MTSAKAFLIRAARPFSLGEDRARREFIFNVLVLGALALLAIAIVDNTAHLILSSSSLHNADSLSSFSFLGLFGFFLILYALSKRGHALVASFIFLAALFDLAAYMGIRWGVDLAASLLFYSLVIAMAGILISARFAFVTAGLAGAAIGITVHLHQSGVMEPDRAWITELWKSDDVLVATVIFLIMGLVMWLSNREIEKSLLRARRSEADLRLERDLLEVRIEERTRELRQAERERMTQAYRFVEFGRLATGIFHDLANPLTGLSMTIDRIADAPEAKEALSEDVQRAKRAAAHMQKLLRSMRGHITRERTRELFSVNEAIEDALALTKTTAQGRDVSCYSKLAGDVHLYGDPVAFTQVLTNLLTNAMQSFPEQTTLNRGNAFREIHIDTARSGDLLMLSVRDTGAGISKDALPRIFDEYFTTKDPEHGIGFGLSVVKRTVEEEFSGSIDVESDEGKGTMFVLQFPIREP